jgi:aspartyl-tRNA synthetase
MHRYRTHNCNDLSITDVGNTARLSGWIHRRRDHGQLVFLDLRDHFGITQCVVDVEDATFPVVESVRLKVSLLLPAEWSEEIMRPLIIVFQQVKSN